MSIMQRAVGQLADKGYVLLKQHLPAEMLFQLDVECQRLTTQASQILADIDASQLSYAAYYQQGLAKLIAVPEATNARQTCRFEYIAASSAFIAEQFVPFCQALLLELAGQPMRLFKDKCNLKLPGGGAFEAHQDIPAYLDFGPNFHVTVAVFLDPATAQNGALEVAENGLSLTHPDNQWQQVGKRPLPILPTYQGGDNNGRIVAELEQQMDWTPVYTSPGDLLLFNSYLPHRSALNHSTQTRRAFFFTFSLASAGDRYPLYYQSKRADFGHPRFHVATPTKHGQ
ncbi:phytanoyl-CoA dioxygenase family protein [Bowmanella pacifica]|uniref:Phytanoyl-CoA dioxygenase n=1 Tax=Bowmanella pacifica TaxID=502051 RepID=A0A918DGR9_9ALTE|nr:phytanoyl-CoA dioxygenase family protein [Bowmanella pacifica]GGO65257.1 hypothetical protein GCM10010982_06620 [Bowmanella pacifica]